MDEVKTRSTKDRMWAALVALAFVAILGWAAVLVAYARRFGGDVSADHRLWAEFGEYAGGLLNPFLGTLTLFGVLFTILLQRDILRVARDQLAEGARVERNQRLLGVHSAFETGFFQLLENARIVAGKVSVEMGELQFEIPSEPSAPKMLLPGNAVRRDGQEALRALWRNFDARFVRTWNRGDYPLATMRDHFESSVNSFFDEYQDIVGPPLRSIADVFAYISDYEHRLGLAFKGFAANPDQLALLQDPALYARIAVDNRSQTEMELFGMYAISKHGNAQLRQIALRHDLFSRSVGKDWWGRQVFLELFPVSPDPGMTKLH